MGRGANKNNVNRRSAGGGLKQFIAMDDDETK
jgi:hypothetical protein